MKNEARNETRQDAATRVIQARFGSLSSASPEYIAELRKQVVFWLESIDLQIAQDEIIERKRALAERS
jgi:hypothetical protein